MSMRRKFELWDKMKEAKNKRTINQLKAIIGDASGDLDAVLSVTLDAVEKSIRAEAATFWFYDRFGDGLIRPKAVYGTAKLGDIYLFPFSNSSLNFSRAFFSNLDT